MNVEVLGVAKVLDKQLDDLYGLAKGRLQTALRKWKTTKNINLLYTKISTVQKVKTIWQIDKEVNLKTFYYPSRLFVENKEIKANLVSKIPDEGNIVIQGTVGQGKSILMRYLCSQELRQGRAIPIFFELRKIQSGETLKFHILQLLDELGFEEPGEVFSFASKAGRLMLFLDGFDEVDPGRTLALISELEHLAKKYENLKIIVSSRPDSGIEKSAFFRVYKVCPLNPSDHPGFLDRLVKDEAQKKNILDAINSSAARIKSLLTTPLMMTLLVVTYKSEQKIPGQASEFYENLFQILLSRHNKTKPGYSRHRKCKELTEKQLQEIFEAFCYLTSKDTLLDLSFDEVYEYAKRSSEIARIACSADHFVNDICKVACMVLEDGLAFRFIHKSVQEYYCASFIKRQPDELAKIFYSSLVEGSHESWRYVLNFCNEIDKYRMTKYFTLPHMYKLLNQSCVIEKGSIKEVKSEFLHLALNSIYLEVGRDDSRQIGGYWSHFQEEPFGYPPLDILFYSKLSPILQKHSVAIKKLLDNPSDTHSVVVAGGDEKCDFVAMYIVTTLGIYEEVKDAIDAVYLDFFEYIRKLNLEVEETVQNTSIFEL